MCFPSSEGANFRSVLDKAVGADQVVRDRYNTQCDMIALLCKPESELNAAIPSANPTKTLQGSEVRCWRRVVQSVQFYCHGLLRVPGEDPEELLCFTALFFPSLPPL